MSGAVVFSFLLLGVGFVVVLYLYVRAEGEWRTTVDRETAERSARRDTREEDDP